MFSSCARRWLISASAKRTHECCSFPIKIQPASLSSSAEESTPLSQSQECPKGKLLEWDKHRLTPDQLNFRTLASDFSKREFVPFASEWDKREYFPVEVLRKAASLGFGGLFCSQDVGGSELSRADGAVIFEALAYGDVSTTAYLSVHNMCCSIIDRYGTEDQRKLWLPQLTRMDLLASYCLTEPCSGSDAASLQTSAKQVAGNGEYILNGTKAFISGGGASDLYLVMARTGVHKTKGISCFLLEKGMGGLSFGCPENKLGWRCQPTTTVIMEDVRVPATNLVGSEGLGLSIALGALDGGRINIAACSVGGAQFCVDATQEYVQTRKQFGKALIDFQNTQFKLADMLTTVHASRLMVAHAASSLDAKDPGATASAAMAKRFATDASYNVSNDALQLHGGYGYLKDYPVERYLRDLRVCTIVEGTNEIMRMVITKQMMKT